MVQNICKIQAKYIIKLKTLIMESVLCNFWFLQLHFDLNHWSMFSREICMWKYSGRRRNSVKIFIFWGEILKKNKVCLLPRKKRNIFSILFKNRITSFSCTFYYVICLFISHFRFSPCLSTRHLSCNLYHNNIFLLLMPLLGVNKKQYGKWVYWIKLGDCGKIYDATSTFSVLGY